ncbi:MAG TPA: cell division protein CrgA [Actinomycetes bacterium]|nr:cell division protein CrgA [Actinomycetes bacterium]
MPKSRSRKKVDFTPPPERRPASSKVSPRWLAPTMCALLLIGLAWIVVYYIAASSIGFVSALGAWNIVIGFAFIMGGLMLSTRWR